MPQSDTNQMEFYPKGWSEEIHDEYFVEWRYDGDSTILVRIDGSDKEDGYSVIPITGVNPQGEEFVTRPISELTRREAFDIAATLIYAMNGTAGRLNEDPDFTGDQA